MIDCPRTARPLRTLRFAPARFACILALTALAGLSAQPSLAKAFGFETSPMFCPLYGSAPARYLEDFAGSEDEILVELLIGSSTNPILVGTFDSNDTPVGETVDDLIHLTWPTSVRNLFSNHLRGPGSETSLPITLRLAGTTFGQPDVFGFTSGTLQGCDTISFLNFGATAEPGTLVEIDVVRKTLEPTNVASKVAFLVNGGAAGAGSVIHAQCLNGDIEIVNSSDPLRLELTFKGPGIRTVTLRVCPGFIGSVELSLIEPQGGSAPSTIVRPDAITLSVEDSKAPGERRIFDGTTTSIRASIPIRSFLSDTGSIVTVDTVGDSAQELDLDELAIEPFHSQLLDPVAAHDLRHAIDRLRPPINVLGGNALSTELASYVLDPDRPDPATAEFLIDAGGSPLPAAGLSSGDRSFMVRSDPPVLTGFTLSNHRFGETPVVVDLGTGTGVAQVRSLGDERWLLLSAQTDGFDVGVVEPGRLLDREALPGSPTSAYLLDGTPNSPAAFLSLVGDLLFLIRFQIALNGALERLGIAQLPAEDGLECPLDAHVIDRDRVVRVCRRPMSDFARTPTAESTKSLISGHRGSHAGPHELVGQVIDWDGNLTLEFEVADNASQPTLLINEENELVVAYRRGGLTYARGFRLPPRPTVCEPSVNTLCLGRYRITGTWADTLGNRAPAEVAALTPTSGYLTFLDPSNPEIFFKLIEGGCSLSARDPHTWVFAGGLTSLWSTWTIEDTTTGVAKTYVNPAGRPYLAVRDVEALGNCDPGSAADIDRQFSERLDRPLARTDYTVGTLRAEPATFENCAEDDETVCIQGGRFRVQIDYRVPGEPARPAHMVRITSDGAYAWFFGADNIEVFVKMLDACALSQSHWFFAAGLTDVEVTVRVTDTETGTERTYGKPSGTAFEPILDFRAFEACS